MLENLPNLTKWYDQVDAVDDESREEEYNLCPNKVKQNAKKILSQVARQYSGQDLDFNIYPTEDQDLHIWCRPKLGYGLLIQCDPNNQVSCFLTTNHENENFCNDINNFDYTRLWGMFKKLSSATRK